MEKLILQEIENQMSVDTELLLQIIGSSGSLGSTQGTSKDGERILKNLKRKVQDKLCKDERIRSIYDNSTNSKIQLAAAILDCIAGAIIGVSPITVSVLLVKEGLDSVCEGIWKHDK